MCVVYTYVLAWISAPPTKLTRIRYLMDVFGSVVNDFQFADLWFNGLLPWNLNKRSLGCHIPIADIYTNNNTIFFFRIHLIVTEKELRLPF